MERRLAWANCWNVRDLGGLPTEHGGITRWGAIVRSDSPHALVSWDPVLAHGIRTVVDLRTISQAELHPVVPPPGTARVHVSIEEDLEADAEFLSWGRQGWLSTPLYYPAFMARFPQRIEAALRAIAEAPPGGVIVHCSQGCDRTGLIAMFLLRLAGVPDEEIVADYLLSDPPDRLAIEAVVQAQNTTREAAMRVALERLDLAFLEPDVASRLRRRLNPPMV